MQLSTFATTVLLSLAVVEASPSKIQTCWWSGRDRCANRYQGAWKREIASYPAVQFDIAHLRTITNDLELNPFKVGRFFGFDDQDEPNGTDSAAEDADEVSIDGLVLTIDAAGIEDFANATGASLDSLKTYFNLV